jgi:hypothetical protein
MKIKWKSDGKNLTKLFPRQRDIADEEDDLPGDAGSFFNFFEHASDPYEVRAVCFFSKRSITEKDLLDRVDCG